MKNTVLRNLLCIGLVASMALPAAHIAQAQNDDMPPPVNSAPIDMPPPPPPLPNEGVPGNGGAPMEEAPPAQAPAAGRPPAQKVGADTAKVVLD